MTNRGTKQTLLSWRESAGVTPGYLLDVVGKGRQTDFPYREPLVESPLKAFLLIPDCTDDLYAPYTGAVPTQKLTEVLVKSIGYLIGKNRLTRDIVEHRSVIMQQADFEDFDRAKKPETVWRSIVEKAEKWWEFTVDNIGADKEVVSPEDISLSERASGFAKESLVSRPYLVPLEGRDYHYCVPVLFEHRGIMCKTVVDIVIVSPKKRKVTIVNVHTPFDTEQESLAYQIRKGNYAVKMSFDSLAVQSTLHYFRAEGFSLDHCFLFVPRSVKGGQESYFPVVWPCTDNMLAWGRYGGQVYGSRTYKFAGDMIGSHYAVSEHTGWEGLLEHYQKCLDEKRTSFKRQPSTITPEQSESLFFT